jgi:GT2 family glycosyltransferase
LLAQAPLYSIVIPSYGKKGLVLLKNLLPILDYSCNLPHEIFVVDDGSDEVVLDELKKLCPMYGTRLFHNETNCGFAKSVNRGIENSNGHVVILCNNDIIPIGNTFDCLGDMVRFSGIGIMGCKLLYEDYRIQHAGVFYAPPPQDLSNVHDMHKNGWFDHLYRFEPRQHPGASTMDQRLICGALMAIHTSTINTIGMLDENFGMAAEDIDFCLRALEAVLGITYNGFVEAFHLEGRTRGNTKEEKDKHPEWNEKEASGLKYLFEKWNGIKWENFSVTS